MVVKASASACTQLNSFVWTGIIKKMYTVKTHKLNFVAENKSTKILLYFFFIN